MDLGFGKKKSKLQRGQLLRSMAMMDKGLPSHICLACCVKPGLTINKAFHLARRTDMDTTSEQKVAPAPSSNDSEEQTPAVMTPPAKSDPTQVVESAESPSSHTIVTPAGRPDPIQIPSTPTTPTQTNGDPFADATSPSTPTLRLNGKQLVIEEDEEVPGPKEVDTTADDGGLELSRAASTSSEGGTFENITLASLEDAKSASTSTSIEEGIPAPSTPEDVSSPELPPIPSVEPSPPLASIAPEAQNGTASNTPAPSSPSISRASTATSSSIPHHRRSSVGSTATISAPGSSSLVSGILIVTALETIAASKEAKKSKPLKEALEKALEALKNPIPPPSSSSTSSSGTVDPLVIFTPLRLACETKSLPLMISALDCIGKLVSYDFFVDGVPSKMVETNEDGEAPPPVEGEQIPLADLVTSTVCDCFSPSPSSSSSSSSAASNPTTTQHDTLLLRLLSSLLSLILSSALAVHQSSLLKAVRTVYNVFLMGRPGTVQTVAQATLGQIVGGVFSRVSVGELAKSLEANENGNVNGSGSVSVNHSRGGSLAESKQGSTLDLVKEGDEDLDAATVEAEGVPLPDVVLVAELPEAERVLDDEASVKEAVSDDQDPAEPVTLYVHRLPLSCEVSLTQTNG